MTDGEYRRAFWHFDFLENLSGVTGYESDSGIQFKGVTTKAHGVRVTGKIDFPDNHPHLGAFQILEVRNGARGQDDHPLAKHAALPGRQKSG